MPSRAWALPTTTIPAEQGATRAGRPSGPPDQVGGGGRGRHPGEELEPARRGVDRQRQRLEAEPRS